MIFMRLTAQEQQEFEKFKNQPTSKYFVILIQEIFEQSLKDFISRIKSAENDQKLFTIGEICEFFSVTAATVHNWKKRGWLIGRRIGKNRYYSQEEVDGAKSISTIGRRY
jgi:hypothetical protein